MYDHAHPAMLGARDVIAAWLVCLAVATAVFGYRDFFADPERTVHAVLENTVPAGARAELCVARDRPIGEKHG